MRVKCIITDGSLLAERYRCLGYEAETMIAVESGKVYEVYATSVWRSIVSVLVVDEDDFPTWYPAEVFEIVCNSIPGDWFFKYYSDNEFGLQAVWGPEYLVKDERFYDALNDREPSALHTFRQELSCR